jgi:hypothetical protein
MNLFTNFNFQKYPSPQLKVIDQKIGLQVRAVVAIHFVQAKTCFVEHFSLRETKHLYLTNGSA